MKDSEALDAIAELLRDTEDWSADTLDEIAELVRRSGREIVTRVIDSDMDHVVVNGESYWFPNDPPAAEVLAVANHNRKLLGLEV